MEKVKFGRGKQGIMPPVRWARAPQQTGEDKAHQDDQENDHSE
jgi:hypothetical protein